MRFFITYLLFFATVAFFNYKGLVPEQLNRHILLLIEIIAIGYAFLFIKKNNLAKDNFNRIYIWMIFFIYVSIVPASMFQDQSLLDSIVIIIPNLLAWSTFFVFLQFNFRYNECMKIIIVLAILGIVTFLINHIMAPNIIFSGDFADDVSRGFLRLKLCFYPYVVLIYLLCVSKIKSIDDKLWMFLSMGLFMIILMMMVRQIILFSSILAGMLLLRKKTITKKIVFFICILFFLLAVLPQIGMFKGLMEYSEKQQEFSEDVDAQMRSRAWNFFIFNQTNEITPFIGNGFPWKDKSAYGKTFIQQVNHNGIYDVDAAWASFFWYYGVFASMSLLFLFIQSMNIIKSERFIYIKYWLFYMIMVNCLSGAIVNNCQISHLTFVFAMIHNNQFEMSGKLLTKSEV